MNNDIKEILDRIKNLKRKCNYCLKIGENMYIPRHDKQTDNLIEAICLINDMADYITNLQEERDMYKGSFETMSKNYFEEKLRCEKAIEFCKKYDFILKWQLLEILEGEDKDE